MPSPAQRAELPRLPFDDEVEGTGSKGAVKSFHQGSRYTLARLGDIKSSLPGERSHLVGQDADRRLEKTGNHIGTISKPYTNHIRSVDFFRASLGHLPAATCAWRDCLTLPGDFARENYYCLQGMDETYRNAEHGLASACSNVRPAGNRGASTPFAYLFTSLNSRSV
jgi:hypothetical protein